MQYILYATHLAAWWSVDARGTDDYKQAQVFSEENAIEFMKRHKRFDGTWGMVPVPLEMLVKAEQ